MILDTDPKQKKKKGVAYFELDEDLDQDWILKHQEFLVDEQRTKIEKKFQKENEKLVADGSKEMKAKELTERLEVADELAKKFKAENKSKKVAAEGKGPTVEKFEVAIEKIDQRIANMELQAEDREGNKEVALGTSKIVSHSRSCAGALSNFARIISIRDSRWSSQRSSMSRLISSSLRLSEKSSPGPLSLSKMIKIGSSETSGHFWCTYSKQRAYYMLFSVPFLGGCIGHVLDVLAFLGFFPMYSYAAEHGQVGGR